MSSPHMSFRLNQYYLARALRILVMLKPGQTISSLSQAAKLIILDWIKDHPIDITLAESQADIAAVKIICKMSANQLEQYPIQMIMDLAASSIKPPTLTKEHQNV